MPKTTGVATPSWKSDRFAEHYHHIVRLYLTEREWEMCTCMSPTLRTLLQRPWRPWSTPARLWGRRPRLFQTGAADDGARPPCPRRPLDIPPLIAPSLPVVPPAIQARVPDRKVAVRQATAAMPPPPSHVTHIIVFSSTSMRLTLPASLRQFTLETTYPYAPKLLSPPCSSSFASDRPFTIV